MLSNNTISNLYIQEYLKKLIPAGSIICHAGSVTPNGWKRCDGSEVSRTLFPELFKSIGTTYGVGNGTTTFNLPNFKGRVPVGRDSSQSEFDLLNKVGGEKTHTLSLNEMPQHDHGGLTSSNGSHTHSVNDPGHSHTFTTINDDYNGSGGNPPGFTTDSTGVKTWTTSSSATGINLNSNGNHTHTISQQGGGNAHNNLQPYIVVHYIIKCF